MRKFRHDGKWYQELDRKDYKIFDEIECLARDSENEDWSKRTLIACVKISGFNFMTTTNSFDQCAIPCDPPESRLMTNLQLMQLLNRGGWVCLYSNNYASLCPVSAEHDLYSSVKGIKVSRIDKIEWIEPTTDLLEE